MTQRIIIDRIMKCYDDFQTEGKIPTKAQIDGYYRLFRQKFGPDTLASLDGEPLLNLMYSLGNRDSLVYWLEFKNDSEFPAIFGSIAGGSALKYGIFKRKETGAWTVGTPQKSYEITTQQAVEIARRNRDELINGVSIIQSMPDSTEDADYYKLQEDLTREAPNVENTAWGHKYFHMLCPEKLDNYHVASFQRFYLLKLLQIPPEGNGRYICAGRFVALSKELEIPVDALMEVLNTIYGRPHRYWKIGTRGNDNTSYWEEMYRENVVSLGWKEVGDLSWLDYSQESKEKLRKHLEDTYNKSSIGTAKSLVKIFDFVTTIGEGDIVVAADGAHVFGIARVVGGYQYKAGLHFPHRRQVEWLSLEHWELPVQEILQSAVYQIRQPKNIFEIEKNVLLHPDQPTSEGNKSIGRFPVPPTRLEGIPGRIQNVLERKRQIILYGPPGTGKTYWATRTANTLASYALYGKTYDELTNEERQLITGQNGKTIGLVQRCTFHPNYGYEDFIEGYRPVSRSGQLVFEKHSGILKNLCEDALKDPEKPHYLIIDEINRGDIPRIFGELITLLEKDKRGQPVLLPLSCELFLVPDNVYIIGTMNTADRSIALLDTALRRRFGFLELMPESRLLNVLIEGLPLGPWLDALNDRIRENIGRDARNLQIGHAYFLEGEKPVSDKNKFIRIFREDILPLLEEYCYEDYDTLGKILGSRLIDSNKQRFNEDILTPEHWDQLIEALLSMTPDLITSSQVLKTQSEEELQPDETVEDDENHVDAG